MKNNTGVRYHMSEAQRFSHMIPGQLSHKLRKALGLKDNQLPKHIYRYINYPLLVIHWILERYSFLLFLNRYSYLFLLSIF